MLTPGLGHTLVGRAVERFGSAREACDASAAGWREIHGVSARSAAGIVEHLHSDDNRGRLDAELAALERAGARLLHLAGDDYPKSLKHIPDPPLLLWGVGRIEPQDALALGVVGSRKCSHYGREQAGRFASQAAQAGLTIVSGGAYGIDTEAHRAAVAAGGRTIAVIGSGLANPYPRDNCDLFDRIVASGCGALISELPMLTSPNPENFPRRNRIISGLSLGVLVVEAALRSGALITARLCVEEHGRELMAVPGRVDSHASAGCHKIIQDGWARLVTNIADVLDTLGDAGRILKQGVTATSGGAPGNEENTSESASPASLFDAAGSDAQRGILEALNEARTLDELCELTQLPPATLTSELTLLEIRGSVRREGGVFLRKTRGLKSE